MEKELQQTESCEKEPAEEGGSSTEDEQSSSKAERRQRRRKSRHYWKKCKTCGRTFLDVGRHLASPSVLCYISDPTLRFEAISKSKDELIQHTKNERNVSFNETHLMYDASTSLQEFIRRLGQRCGFNVSEIQDEPIILRQSPSVMVQEVGAASASEDTNTPRVLSAVIPSKPIQAMPADQVSRIQVAVPFTSSTLEQARPQTATKARKPRVSFLKRPPKKLRRSSRRSKTVSYNCGSDEDLENSDEAYLPDGNFPDEEQEDSAASETEAEIQEAEVETEDVEKVTAESEGVMKKMERAGLYQSYKFEVELSGQPASDCDPLLLLYWTRSTSEEKDLRSKSSDKYINDVRRVGRALYYILEQEERKLENLTKFDRIFSYNQALMACGLQAKTRQRYLESLSKFLDIYPTCNTVTPENLRTVKDQLTGELRKVRNKGNVEFKRKRAREQASPPPLPSDVDIASLVEKADDFMYKIFNKIESSKKLDDREQRHLVGYLSFMCIFLNGKRAGLIKTMTVTEFEKARQSTSIDATIVYRWTVADHKTSTTGQAQIQLPERVYQLMKYYLKSIRPSRLSRCKQKYKECLSMYQQASETFFLTEDGTVPANPNNFLKRFQEAAKIKSAQTGKPLVSTEVRKSIENANRRSSDQLSLKTLTSLALDHSVTTANRHYGTNCFEGLDNVHHTISGKAAREDSTLQKWMGKIYEELELSAAPECKVPSRDAISRITQVYDKPNLNRMVDSFSNKLINLRKAQAAEHFKDLDSPTTDQIKKYLEMYLDHKPDVTSVLAAHFRIRRQLKHQKESTGHQWTRCNPDINPDEPSCSNTTSSKVTDRSSDLELRIDTTDEEEEDVLFRNEDYSESE